MRDYGSVPSAHISGPLEAQLSASADAPGGHMDLSAIAALLQGTEQAAGAAEQGAEAETAGATRDADLVTATASARAEVQSVAEDLVRKKIFDPYLRLKLAEDERAYREREQQRQRQIAMEEAKHTPEGEYTATTLEIAQLGNAHARHIRARCMGRIYQIGNT